MLRGNGAGELGTAATRGRNRRPRQLGLEARGLLELSFETGGQEGRQGAQSPTGEKQNLLGARKTGTNKYSRRSTNQCLMGGPAAKSIRCMPPRPSETVRACNRWETPPPSRPAACFRCLRQGKRLCKPCPAAELLPRQSPCLHHTREKAS